MTYTFDIPAWGDRYADPGEKSPTRPALIGGVKPLSLELLRAGDQSLELLFERMGDDDLTGMLQHTQGCGFVQVQDGVVSQRMILKRRNVASFGGAPTQCPRA